MAQFQFFRDWEGEIEEGERNLVRDLFVPLTEAIASAMVPDPAFWRGLQCPVREAEVLEIVEDGDAIRVVIQGEVDNSDSAHAHDTKAVGTVTRTKAEPLLIAVQAAKEKELSRKRALEALVAAGMDDESIARRRREALVAAGLLPK
ncbi:MAG: hypothetical protein WC730_02235 [Patescibacteria group bacterium]|jgi:hypothetical protein